MAVTINEKNFFQVIGTSVADSYAPTVPCTIVNMQVCNKSAAAASLTVYLYDASADTSYELVASVPISAGQTITLINRNLILEAGDKIRAVASAANALVLSGFAAEKVVS